MHIKADTPEVTCTPRLTLSMTPWLCERAGDVAIGLLRSKSCVRVVRMLACSVRGAPGDIITAVTSVPTKLVSQSAIAHRVLAMLASLSTATALLVRPPPCDGHLQKHARPALSTTLRSVSCTQPCACTPAIDESHVPSCDLCERAHVNIRATAGQHQGSISAAPPCDSQSSGRAQRDRARSDSGRGSCGMQYAV